ncbi:MAG: TraR/DksA family transcriptional regulator [Methylococcales bacterium]
MKEFKQVCENLLDMLEDIDERLSKITDDVNVDDNAITKKTNTVDNKGSMYSDIKNIENALSKIDSGTYGICLSCGQAIKKEFLHTSPLSSFCPYCTHDKKAE